MHVRDVVDGEKAGCLMSDGLAAKDLGLTVDVGDAAGGGKMSWEEFRTCQKAFQ